MNIDYFLSHMVFHNLNQDTQFSDILFLPFFIL